MEYKPHDLNPKPYFQYTVSFVQVHPTGLVHPGEPDAKVKFLAAEALRGVGGILVDANGDRYTLNPRSQTLNLERKTLNHNLFTLNP